MRAWKYLEQIARLPARGSATEGERAAARWLEEQLSALGYDVEMQSFRSPRHTLYIGPTLVIIVLLGALSLSMSEPAVATLLAAAAFVPLVGEMLGTSVNFNLLLPKSTSQNVIARPARSTGDDGNPAIGGVGKSAAVGSGKSVATDAPNVVVLAHYDTQWGSWLFAPGFRRFLQPFFIVTYAGLVLAFVTILLRWIVPGAYWTETMASIAIVMLVATGAFLFGSWLTGRPVPGANDNGSGVAVVLAAAARWMEQANNRGDGAAGPAAEADGATAGADGATAEAAVNPLFLFTGCEEVGLRGVHRFLEDAELAPDTVFINVDNVGGGRLRYFLGEGMLAYQHYDPELLATAREVSERYGGQVIPLKNWLLPTDGLPPAKAGFPAITFLAMNDGHWIPHYHWHSDTIDNVDRHVVEFTEKFIWDYIQAVAERTRMT